jgi:hypothetical protein
VPNRIAPDPFIIFPTPLLFLGAISERQLGSEAEDGGQPVHAGGQDDLPMVPAASP